MRSISTAAWLSSTALVATMSYFLDPAAGRRRRARAVEAVDHGVHQVGRGLGLAFRDLHHRVHGIASIARGAAAGDGVADDVIANRVHSRLGHVCSHPHAVKVSCQDGSIELRGPILEREAEAALRVARSTLGVKGVVDRLERHAVAGSVSGLQGEPRSSRRKRGTWPPAARLVVGGVGALTSVAGLARGSLLGLGAAMCGAVAVARSVANIPLVELGGVGKRRPAVDVDKTITIRAPVQEVLELFTKPENFPRFMRHVKEVRRLGENRWRWKVVGPGGTPYEWEGYLDRIVPNELVSWKSAEGAPVANTGSVCFETVAPGVTRLTIRLRYWPPGGLIGHEIARLLGDDPKRELDEDMMRVKSLLELGKTTGPDGTVTWDELRSP